MKAVTFRVSVPGYLKARTLGRITDSAVFGALSGLGMEERSPTALPGPGWVRLRVLLSGICGSDIGNLTYSSSPSMEPFGSFPAVLGHEILARVEEVGAESGLLRPGMRVAVDPMLSCRVRGWPEPCPSCRAGLHGTCERAGEEGPLEVSGSPLAPGLTMGYHRDLPGGWCPEIIAHRSQLFPVEELDDRTAVLVEPLSIGMHAAIRTPLPDSGPVLVIGSGAIALGTIWALRALGWDGELVAQTKRAHEGRIARVLGADEVVAPGDEARQALIDTGARAYMPIIGPEVYAGGGFPLIFDCVGNEGSLGQALRHASPRGRLVVLGCAGEIRKLDLTMLWARELRVSGFVGYGREEWRGEALHTFEVTRRLLEETRAPVREIVTHVFPLGEYRDALSAAARHGSSEAVKVALEP
ncbi:MAG TPA: alcohol dehydrogenase catalytic domain-containing protein [Longimicrobiales bacterium]|nr:alcohol dehydrogenase catalytic domain-containing protein [Longimicrobiales bacterium]